MRVLAELLQPTAAETPYGGRSVTYAPVGVFWLAPGARRRRARSEAGGERTLETLTAVTRVDPRLVEGRVLRFGGADWTIAAVDADDGRLSKANLTLERSR